WRTGSIFAAFLHMMRASRPGALGLCARAHSLRARPPMFPTPKPESLPNTYAYESGPMVKATGFREYDARWLFGKEINLMGVQALGMGLGTLIHQLGAKPEIVTGHDFRGYSASIKYALVSGLLAAGCKVHDIGLAVTPMAYFAQFALDVPCVAMVTASHNDNGWTGGQMGANRPLTFGPDEMTKLKEIVLGAKFNLKGGGAYAFVENFHARYVADLTKRPKLKRKLKVVCACGNGTAGAFAPGVLEAVGCEVIRLDCELDHTFPHYNPNTEDMKMLHAMRDEVLRTKADVALGFDGDGDRCGVVDDEGEEIFADKVGVMLGRALGGGRQVARPVPARSGAAAEGRQGRLLEDRPLLHEAPGQRDRRARRLREVGPLLLQQADRPRLRRRADLRARGLRHARAQSREEDVGPQERAAEDVVVADHGAALRRRDEVRRRRGGGEALRGGATEGREGRRPADPRSRHRQRRARHGRGRHLGSGARVIEQARAGGGGRESGVGDAHARHVQGG